MQEPPRDGESTYGMGWYVIQQPELPTYLGHGGNLVTTASHMVYDPTTGTAIAVLLDSNGPAALLTLNLRTRGFRVRTKHATVLHTFDALDRSLRNA